MRRMVITDKSRLISKREQTPAWSNWQNQFLKAKDRWRTQQSLPSPWLEYRHSIISGAYLASQAIKMSDLFVAVVFGTEIYSQSDWSDTWRCYLVDNGSALLIDLVQSTEKSIRIWGYNDRQENLLAALFPSASYGSSQDVFLVQFLQPLHAEMCCRSAWPITRRLYVSQPIMY